jgi:hypothetical protein
MFAIPRFAQNRSGRRVSGDAASQAHRRRARRAWTVEALEERALLSTWTVNGLADSGTGTGLSGDLRYCITQANQHPGADVIDFQAGLKGTINLTTGELLISDSLKINGPGATVIKVSGQGSTRDFEVATGTTVTIGGLTIENGRDGDFSGKGGGILNMGVLTVSGESRLTGNFAYSGGGAICNLGTVTISGGSTLTGNFAYSEGGAIYNLGTVTISGGSTLSDNTAFGGGAISNLGTVTVDGSTLSGNSTQGVAYSGGAIYNRGTAMVRGGSVLSDNSAAYGGAIFNGNGTVTVDSSTLSGNSAQDGGGIYNVGRMTVSDCTITDNSAIIGGGINNVVSLTVSDCTITDNSCGMTAGGEATLYNTIVARNARDGTDDDISLLGGGTVSSTSAYNLIGIGGSGGLVNGVNGNQVGVANPGLGLLANNGGPTQTIALLPGSPAIDAGSNAGIPAGVQFDQRGPGFPRIANGTVDIGAFELPSTHLAVTAQPPASIIAGTSFSLTVTAKDSSGNLDRSFHGAVTVALANNPGGATLGGTLIVTAQNGVATFAGLTLDKAGAGYTLLVSGSGLVSGTTTGIDVTPTAATHLVVTTQPPGRVGVGIGFGLTVAAEDRFANVDTSFSRTVTVALANNPGGATLGGTLTVTAQNGVATFTGLTLDKAGTGYAILVSSNGLTGARTDAFNASSTFTYYTVDLTSASGAGSDTTGDLVYVIALANANPNPFGSVIQFDPAVFSTPQTITLSSTLELSEKAGPLVIQGPGADLLTISGNNAVRVFEVDSGVTATLIGLTITGGRADGRGGGILSNGGQITLSHVVVSNNKAVGGAGPAGVNHGFPSGPSPGGGGRSAQGGGLYASGGAITLIDSALTEDSAVGGDGGRGANGFYAAAGGGGGSAQGGGLYADGSTITLIESSLTNDSATGGAGGNGGDYSSGSHGFGGPGGGGSAQGGGLCAVGGSLSLVDSVVTGDTATGGAGGAGGYSVSFPANGGNGGSAQGGGLFSSGTLTVVNSTLAFNCGSGGDGGYGSWGWPGGNGGSAQGGGLYIDGVANGRVNSLVNATITGDTATGGAGAREYGNGGSAQGGGLFNSGALTVTNSTIAFNNSNGTGGGLEVQAGTATLENTIVALNTQGTGSGAPASDINGTVAPASAYNLIGTGGSGGLVDRSTDPLHHNQVGVADPRLGPLADNGGPTQTIALLPGSPAINAGSNALAVDAQGHSLSTDQRGTEFPRILGGTVDIGASEAPIPSSSVKALPKRGTSLGFAVSVSGSDAPTASPPSGITTFDLYVSTNGGPWTF